MNDHETYFNLFREEIDLNKTNKMFWSSYFMTGRTRWIPFCSVAAGIGKDSTLENGRRIWKRWIFLDFFSNISTIYSAPIKMKNKLMLKQNILTYWSNELDRRLFQNKFIIFTVFYVLYLFYFLKVNGYNFYLF